MSSPPDRTILFAGGGSGGHLAPGIAVAERLRGRSACHFACSTRTIDAEMLAADGWSMTALPAHPLSLRPRGAVQWIRGFIAAERRVAALLRERNIRAVLALGGFVSAPAARAAFRAGIPVILLNLDAVPGRANRLVRRWCTTVLSAVSVDAAHAFPADVVGMPVRRAAIASISCADAAECRRALSLDRDRPVLLITGASQGARSLNDLMPALAARAPHVLSDWQILHLCGRGEGERTVRAWKERGADAVVHEFLHEMGLAWGSADLAISRAGASSVAEAALNCVPAIFLPYPWHRDEHQSRNAAPLVNAGAALLIRDRIDPETTLAESGAVIIDALRSAEHRAAMRTQLERMPRIDAAARVADLLLQTATVNGA